MITGVRGSGKTVMMTNIASEMRKQSDEWIVVELNPNRDLFTESGDKDICNSRNACGIC